MTLDELADRPGLLIAAIAITCAVLTTFVLIDFASRRFWRWWLS